MEAVTVPCKIKDCYDTIYYNVCKAYQFTESSICSQDKFRKSTSFSNCQRHDSFQVKNYHRKKNRKDLRKVRLNQPKTYIIFTSYYSQQITRVQVACACSIIIRSTKLKTQKYSSIMTYIKKKHSHQIINHSSRKIQSPSHNSTILVNGLQLNSTSILQYNNFGMCNSIIWLYNYSVYCVRERERERERIIKGKNVLINGYEQMNLEWISQEDSSIISSTIISSSSSKKGQTFKKCIFSGCHP